MQVNPTVPKANGVPGWTFVFTLFDSVHISESDVNLLHLAFGFGLFVSFLTYLEDREEKKTWILCFKLRNN